MVSARVVARDYSSVARILAAAIISKDPGKVDAILAAAYQTGGAEAVARIMDQLALLSQLASYSAVAQVPDASRPAPDFRLAPESEFVKLNRWDVMSGLVPHSRQWALWRIGSWREARGENADDIWRELVESLQRTEGNP